MTRRLLITYLTISALALAALAIPLGITFAQRERDRLYFEIERDASAVSALSEDALESGTPPPLEATLAHYRETTRGRIVVVDKSGKSVADSNDPNTPGEDYSNRPEIASALQGRRAIGTRHSNTAGGSLVYVAIPVASGGVVHGAVRITYPTAALDARVRNAWVRLGLLCAFVLAAIAAVGFLLARSVTRPVQKLEETAEQMADGDLSARAPTEHGAPELRGARGDVQPHCRPTRTTRRRAGALRGGRGASTAVAVGRLAATTRELRAASSGKRSTQGRCDYRGGRAPQPDRRWTAHARAATWTMRDCIQSTSPKWRVNASMLGATWGPSRV